MSSSIVKRTKSEAQLELAKAQAEARGSTTVVKKRPSQVATRIPVPNVRGRADTADSLRKDGLLRLSPQKSPPRLDTLNSELASAQAAMLQSPRKARQKLKAQCSDLEQAILEVHRAHGAREPPTGDVYLSLIHI